jgi:hypothetical protein
MKNKGEILTNILKNYKDCYLFLHNTKELNTVNKIIRDGFLFENQLPHSTDRVNPNDTIEISYFLFQRKDYGSYTIIIAIPKKTYDKYSCLSLNEDIPIEDILTVKEPFLGENDELIYTLPRNHILGYFNLRTDEFVINPAWDFNFINDRCKNPENS